MDDAALRATNRATVEAFLELRGPDRGRHRVPLFAEDSRVEMFVASGAHLDLDGRQWCLSTPYTFPEWGFYEATIFEGPDPRTFLVPAVGRGRIYGPGTTGPGYDVELWYILLFELEDGEITLFRETVDYCRGGDVITDQYTPDRPDLFVRHDNPFARAR